MHFTLALCARDLPIKLLAHLLHRNLHSTTTGELSVTEPKVKGFARYLVRTAIHIAIHVD